MDAACICKGCGRDNCGAYGGRPFCQNQLRKRGWATYEGYCTSCVCAQCGATGQPCFGLCPTRLPAIPTLPTQPPVLTDQPRPQSVHPTAASSHQPQPQPQIHQHIGDQVIQPAPSANSDGVSPWAEASAQAVAAANAAVPHEEPAAPGHAVANWIVAPEPTMADLLALIVDLQRRISAVEREFGLVLCVN